MTRVSLAGRIIAIKSIGCASKIEARFFIHLSPGALTESNNAGGDAVGNEDGPENLAVLARDHDHIAILDAALGCIDGVHEGFLGEGLTKPRYIVETGVAAALIVDGVELQRIVTLDLGIPVGEGLFVAFDGRIVLRQGILQVEATVLDPIRERLAVDLELAGGGLDGIGFRIRNESGELGMAEFILRVALYAVDTSLLEFLVRDTTLLGFAFGTDLGNIFLGDGQEGLKIGAVLLLDLGAGQLIKDLLRLDRKSVV